MEQRDYQIEGPDRIISEQAYSEGQNSDKTKYLIGSSKRQMSETHASSTSQNQPGLKEQNSYVEDLQGASGSESEDPRSALVKQMSAELNRAYK